MFKKRLLTFLIGAPIVVWTTLKMSPFLFSIVLLFLMMLAAWEWSRLMGAKENLSRLGYVLLIGVVISLLYFGIAYLYWLLTIPLFCWLLALIAIIIYPKSCNIWSGKVNLGILGIVILGACWLSLVLLRQTSHGIGLVLYLLLLVWAADSGAYIFGKLYGKHKMAPQLSPGKTIEGALGGVVIAGTISIISGFLFGIRGWQWATWLSLALLTTIMSIFGDLLVSMLKRQQGLNDTGQLLPGHGGILDRVDSLLSAAPFFTFFYLLIIF